MKRREVIVIGGGVAGGTAAAQLARNGIDVLLLERELQDHHKVCGEFISYEAQHYLKKLDIHLAGHNAQVIDRISLIRKNKSLTAFLGFSALSLSRHRLDNAIVSTACLQGAEIKYGVTVTGIKADASEWRVECKDHEPICARTIFLATGKHDVRNCSYRNGQRNDYIGFKMHFQVGLHQQALLRRDVKIVFFHGGYAGLEPIEDGKANLCFVITKERFSAHGKNWEAVLNYILQTTPALAACLAGAAPCWDKPLAIFGIPYGFLFQVSRQDPPAFFRLGDQMAVIPSFCGDGIAIALHTAFLAAECYLNSSAYDYHDRARQQLVDQIEYATTISHLLNSAALQPLAFPLCRVLPALVPTVIQRTRIKAILN
jgi:flavin-dependent dehydrogenase